MKTIHLCLSCMNCYKDGGYKLIGEKVIIRKCNDPHSCYIFKQDNYGAEVRLTPVRKRGQK